MSNVLKIRIQEYEYDCGLCGEGILPSEDGRWCLMIADTDSGICVCQSCHDAHPTGEISLAEWFAKP